MQTTLRPLRTWLISALTKSCACMRSADQKEYKVIIQIWSVFHVLLGAFSGNKQFGYCLDTFVTGFIHELTRECFTENQITKAWFLSTNFLFVNCKMCFTFFNSGNSRKLTVDSVSREASRFEAGRTLCWLFTERRKSLVTVFNKDDTRGRNTSVIYRYFYAAGSRTQWFIFFLISAFPMRIFTRMACEVTSSLSLDSSL